MKKSRAVTVLGLVGLSAQLLGCGTLFGGKSDGGTWTLKSAQQLPAASGQVRVSKGDQGNQTVEVSVKHLAHPREAFPGTSTYVVWLVPREGGQPQNMGALQVGDNLAAELKTKTPYRSFEIVITAEDRPNVAEPSGNRAMMAAVSLPG